MKLITIRSQIKEVSELWNTTYADGKHGGDKVEIGKILAALDLDVCGADDIERVIGNDTWACRQRCNECGKKFRVVIVLGEEPDHESSTAQICFGCLNKAMKQMEACI